MTMSAKEIKDDRKYTADHEWARLVDGKLLVGITAFAVDQLGDITLVNLDVSPGDRIEKHAAFGTIESVKTLSDLFSPVSGEVVEVNTELEEGPELINDDCWEKGWMIAIKCDSDADVDKLLDDASYRKHVEESAH